MQVKCKSHDRVLTMVVSQVMKYGHNLSEDTTQLSPAHKQQVSAKV